MTLARSALWMLVAACALLAAPARADVLEVGEDGPVWIAGKLAEAARRAQEAALAQDGAALTETGVPITDPDAAFLSATIPAPYRAKVRELAARYDLSPSLIEALVWQESRWRHNAVSRAGARGLTQLMPGTARDMRVNPDDPFANLEGGARYLRVQLNRFGGDLELALAAYNAGPNRVAAARGVPAIAETRNYVAAIMRRLSTYSQE